MSAASIRWACRYPRSWVRWRRSELQTWIDAAPWRKPPPKHIARCVSGYPMGDRFVCHRPAIDTTLWCRKHTDPEQLVAEVNRLRTALSCIARPSSVVQNVHHACAGVPHCSRCIASEALR